MKPKPRQPEQDDLLRPRLVDLIDMRHELVKLETLIEWEFFEREWAGFFPSGTGRPATSPPLVAGLLYLQHAFDLSDEAVVARWVENPYYQHLCGETFFQHRPPIDPSSLTRWRQRIGEEGVEWLLTKNEEEEERPQWGVSLTNEAGRASGTVADRSLERVSVDTTVMEKNIAHPTAAAAAQLARRDPALPRVLGLQPGDADSPVARGFGTALRRDDGRQGRDHEQGDRAPRGRTLPGGYGDPEQALSRRSLGPRVKDLLADVYEQLGYQQENPGLRNSFLSGAYELRTGIPQGERADSAGPDVIRAMSTGLFLDYLAIKMDGRKAEGLDFSMNLVTPDNGERFAVDLSNATLTNVEGFEIPDGDLTLTVNRSDLELVMVGEAELGDLLADGRASAEGDISVLASLAATMVEFDPLFEVLPGTAGPIEVVEAEALQAVTGQVAIE